LKKVKSGLKASDFLRRQRRSDLQEHFLFWYPGEKAPRASKDIASRLVEAYADPACVQTRFDKLPASQRNFLRALVTEPGYVAPLSKVLKNAVGKKIPQYEIEGILKALATNGFIASIRYAPKSQGGVKFFSLVAEVGEILRKVCETEAVSYVVISLEDFLKGFSRGKYELFMKRFLGPNFPRGVRGRSEAVKKLSAPAAVRKRLKNVADRELRTLARRAIREHGGIMRLSRRVRQLLYDDPARRSAWKRALEDNLIGSIGILDLKECGIEIEEEVFAVFAEVVAEAELSEQVPEDEIETVVGMDLDFFRDLTAFLRHLKTRKVRLCGSGTFYREDAKIVLEHSVFSDSIDYSDDEIMNYLDATARGLKLIEHEHFVKLTRKGRIWEHMELIDKARALVELARDWLNEGGADFHMCHLRPIAMEHLAGLKPGRWYRIRTLVTLAINTYITRLEELGVAEMYGNYKFARSKPGLKLRNRMHEFQEDLFWWLRNRVFPLGVIEFANCDDEITAFRVSPLGAQVFASQTREPKAAKTIIVNPDFEILLFPEGNYFKLMADLHEFAIKEKKDQITHFRITEHSIKEAVFHRFEVEEILKILEKHSKTPLPQGVEFCVLDWGNSLSVATMSEVVLLEAESVEAFRRVKNIPAVEKLIVREISDRAAVIKRLPDKRRLAKELKPMGVYLR